MSNLIIQHRKMQFIQHNNYIVQYKNYKIRYICSVSFIRNYNLSKMFFKAEMKERKDKNSRNKWREIRNRKEGEI